MILGGLLIADFLRDVTALTVAAAAAAACVIAMTGLTGKREMTGARNQNGAVETIGVRAAAPADGNRFLSYC
ncbi:MAG: hypothetical protein E7255_16415 [Lachnospiraceae bacterium]|nr:hypothetical protein [Lachnospiraceae bacterium]